MVNWVAVSTIITAIALIVSAAVFVVQLVDRRRVRANQDRAQAEQVSGWLTVNRKEKSWTAYVRNGSTQPVYDIVYVVRDKGDYDAAMPEFIPIVPPETTWDWSPTFFSEPEGRVNPRAYVTFRDGRGLAWQRDSVGRLTQTRRPVDDVPPADTLTGRIYQNDNDEDQGGYLYTVFQEQGSTARWVGIASDMLRTETPSAEPDSTDSSRPD